jgi:hypothetical protein
MSEEVAASIGDVLAENARLKQQLAQAERDAEAWRQAVQRLERRCEQTKAVNLLLNARVMEAERYQVRPWLAMLKDADDTAEQLLAVALAHHANYTAALDAGRRLLAAWRTQRQYRYALADALQGLLDEPYGCPLCDCGRTRNPAKGHWPECPYEIARVVLAESAREG